MEYQEAESLQYFNSNNQTQISFKVDRLKRDYRLFCDNTVSDEEKLILFEAFLKISKLNKEKQR